MTTTEDVVRRYFAALDSEDWEALGQLFHEQARYRAPGTPAHEGRADVVARFRAVFAAWAEHSDTVTDLIVQGDRAAVEVLFTATTRTGRPIAFDAVDLFRVRDGRIVDLSMWYDLGAVRRMLAD
ncbi:nuclear transport factor 2 family protein [Blastococcus sp. SYSU D00669]